MDFYFFVWLFAIVVVSVFIFLQVFILISFADLESDYVKPNDLTSNLNKFLWPEFILHAVLTLLFLVTLYPIEFVLNAPLVGYHVYTLVLNKFHYDPTRIFRVLQNEKRKSQIKLGFHLFMFFVYLYRYISSIFPFFVEIF